MLLLEINLTGVVLVEAACVVVWACATVSTRFHQVEATMDGALCVEPTHWSHP